MTQINTVLGTIDSKDLGFTLMHEHIALFDLVMRQNFKKWFNREDAVETAFQELMEAKKLGVNTIVEASPINIGRDISITQELSKRTGINFIVSTGFYWTDEPWILAWDPEQIAEYAANEVMNGIENTNSVKANIIKAGTELHGVTPFNYKFLKIAALLHMKTGLPITTHTVAAQEIGLIQQDIFAATGVDLTKVIIGHCGDTTNLDYIQKILDRGSYVGLDRFGIEFMLSDELRMQTVIELCKRGYEKQLILSHDYCSTLDWAPDRYFNKILPNWNYWHLSKNIIPALKEKGLSQKQIDTMTIENPRRIFESAHL